MKMKELLDYDKNRPTSVCPLALKRCREGPKVSCVLSSQKVEKQPDKYRSIFSGHNSIARTTL